MGEKRRFAQFAESAHENAGMKSKKTSNGSHLQDAADKEPTTPKLSNLAAALAEVVADSTSLELFLSTAGDKGPDLIKTFKKALKPHSKPQEPDASPSQSIDPTANSQVIIPSQIAPSSSDPTTLPPLPPVIDPALKAASFTHLGVLPHADPPRHDLSYERLEYLGDAYLECIASRLIYDRFPLLPSGRLAQIRESLVNNWTLASYAQQYGFDALVRIPADVNQRGKAGTKIHADVFEAYVAALILQSPANGFATVEQWMSALWAPKLQQSTLVPTVNVGAKQDLAKKILTKGIKIEYKQVKEPQRSTEDKGKVNYFVDVFLTGWGYKHKKLGSGTGWSMGQAGCRAAMEALANEVLIAEISELKKETDAKRAAEREAKAQ